MYSVCVFEHSYAHVLIQFICFLRWIKNGGEHVEL